MHRRFSSLPVSPMPPGYEIRIKLKVLAVEKVAERFQAQETPPQLALLNYSDQLFVSELSLLPPRRHEWRVWQQYPGSGLHRREAGLPADQAQ
jgi:hypothetical protein